MGLAKKLTMLYLVVFDNKNTLFILGHVHNGGEVIAVASLIEGPQFIKPAFFGHSMWCLHVFLLVLWLFSNSPKISMII